MKPVCSVLELGLVDYRAAWRLQGRLAAEIAAGERPATLLLLEHPHTYTFGRRGEAQNLLWDEPELKRRGLSVIWVDRGGDVTYHGPGQLVGYPLLQLAPGGLMARPGQRLPQADYIGYLRKLESSLILALARLGIRAVQVEGLTGVWAPPDALPGSRARSPAGQGQPAKIASIGVKVDVRGVTRHGFALNVDPDMSYWEGIVGCGLGNHPTASLADLRDPPPAMSAVIEALSAAFGEIFGYQMTPDPAQARRLADELIRGTHES
jgi:lipoate-protein ligase B